MVYKALAKLNLFLHVVGRRADGFHNIETVFQLVDLHDTLTITTRDDGRILRNPPPDDALLASLHDDADLTVRAARLLQQETGCRLGANIHVHKRIPAGGGMGGGSSDAACVLRALNTQWSLDLTSERLAELGLALGSDVPLFIYGQTAFGSGRGEILTPLELPQRWFLVVHPPVSVSTRDIFNTPQLTRNTPPLRIRALPADGGRNDCEAVVAARYPQIEEVLAKLAPSGGRLTGTGSCVFVAADSRTEVAGLAERLPAHWHTFIVRGLQQSGP